MKRRLLIGLALTGFLLAQRGNISIDQIKVADRKGNGAKLQVFGAGSTTTGHVAIYDANGNLVDGGVPGTGSVTTINTTAPITGGPITVTGTIACPTCVTSGSGGTAAQSPVVFPYAAPIVPMGLSITAPVTIASTNVATTLIGKSFWGSASLPPGYWLGRTVRVYATGLYGSTGTPTLTLILKLGGVTVATIAPTILGSVSNDGWVLEYVFTIASMTSVNGSGCFQDIGTAGAVIGGCAAATTTGLDFSTAQTMDLTATWSASSSSNTITAYVATFSPLS